MCITEIRAKDGKRVWELPEDRERDTRSRPVPTGWPEAHTSAQASAPARADAWGGKPMAESAAVREKWLGAKAGEGKHKRRRVGGRCWHLGTSADERSGTCRCACSQCPPRHAREASPHPCVSTHRPGTGHRPGPATSSSRLPLPSAISSPAPQARSGASWRGWEHGQPPLLPSHEPLLRGRMEVLFPPSLLSVHSLGPPSKFKAKAQR